MDHRTIALLAFAISAAAGKTLAQLVAALDAADPSSAPMPATVRTTFNIRDAAGNIIGVRTVAESIAPDGTRTTTGDVIVPVAVL